MQADASLWDSLVFGGIDDVDVETVAAAFGMVEVVVRGRAAGAVCPDCGCLSGRIRGPHDPRLLPEPADERCRWAWAWTKPVEVLSWKA
ncbi:hypothetical protein ACWIID_14010 [Streptomyces phaeochromogenes]